MLDALPTVFSIYMSTYSSWYDIIISGRGHVMIEILRDGFYRNILVVIITSILLGTLVTIASSGAMDKYFGDFVSGLIGDVGEYDIIVHANAEMAEAAEKELQKGMDTEFPGARVKKGVTVAGNANFLVYLPERYRTREGLESFPGAIRDLPGSNGYTVMIEPRLTIRTTVPQVREYLLEKVSSIEGVKFAYINRGSIEVILNSEEDMPVVEQETNELLGDMKLVQIRLDDSFDSTMVSQDLSQRLGENLVRDVSNPKTTSEQKILQKGLRQMRNILELYPSNDSVVGKINDLADVLDKLQSPLSEDALYTLMSSLDEQVISALDVLEAARIYEMVDSVSTRLLEIRTSREYENLFSGEIETLSDVLSSISEQLETTGDAAGLESSPWLEKHLEEVKQGIDTLSRRAENTRQELLGQIGPVIEDTSRADEFIESFTQVIQKIDQLESSRGLPEEVYHDSINQLQEIIKGSTGDIGRIASSVRQLADTLPAMSEKERNNLIQTIDGMLAQDDNDDKLLVLVNNSISDNEIQSVVSAASGSDSTVVVSAAGIVESSIRGIVYRIIGETRSIVSALIALVITGMLLAVDHSSVMSTAKTLSRLKGRGVSNRATALYGMAVGSIMFALIYAMSAASIPYFGPLHICITGAILGLVAALLSEKLCPTNEDEIAAGLSLGLSVSEVMEEIVIPTGRPGLMQYLISRKQKMPRLMRGNLDSR